MKWFEIWFEDMVSIIATMRNNMVADLAVGYNPDGPCIRKQAAEIEIKQINFDSQMERFKYMGDAKVNRWCYYDLKKRGVIS